MNSSMGRGPKRKVKVESSPKYLFTIEIKKKEIEIGIEISNMPFTCLCFANVVSFTENVKPK